MQLSVIIVNYNVEFFLEECLNSVKKATEGIDAEIFVVDNNSVDGSLRMLRERFPEVKLIANKENIGFSRANNQAMQVAQGKYILLLNPDTVVEQDTFSKALAFMEKHADAGGLGVKMIDGKGNFLPESKRGLPTPATAFYKIFGLSKLFPKSKIFGKYHLGYLDNDSVHQVDILSGAFMLMRKEVLDKTGFLDESFFMYGEDIDLSYRILKAGYKNYYFPETRIIHYKGESTRKTSVNYVFMFYNAMIVFARKHFSQKNARLFSVLIHLAIYLRASVAIINRLFTRLATPIIDAAAIYGGVLTIKNYWEQYVKFDEGIHYPIEFMYYVLPSYLLIWMFTAYLTGAYDRPVKPVKAVRGVLTGTIAILVIYALLPEQLRFSRALILFGALWASMAMPLIRYLLHFSRIAHFKLADSKNLRFAVAGSKEECLRVSEIVRSTNTSVSFIAPLSITYSDDQYFTGSMSQIDEIVQIYKINEVVFCSRDIPSQDIITQMTRLRMMELDYKIAPPDSIALIGSSSKHSSGDIYIYDVNTVFSSQNRRNKRLLDLGASLIFLIFLPVLSFVNQHPWGLLKNIFMVISGKRTWIGYDERFGPNSGNLPSILKCIIPHTEVYKINKVSTETIQKLNTLYAKDYSYLHDISILLKCLKKTGQ